MPQPKPGATLPSPPTGRAKTGGKDFEPSQNSHDGEVFRRGADHISRGSIKLLLGQSCSTSARRSIAASAGSRVG